MPGESEERRDFAEHPVYQLALRLCAQVLDLETRFPDDEQPLLYAGLKRCAVEAGSLLAAGFGRSQPATRLELWEQARSRMMEARHLILVARMRYLVDSKDVESFEALYFETLEGIETLIGRAAGEGFVPAPKPAPRRRR